MGLQLHVYIILICTVPTVYHSGGAYYEQRAAAQVPHLHQATTYIRTEQAH